MRSKGLTKSQWWALCQSVSATSYEPLSPFWSWRLRRPLPSCHLSFSSPSHSQILIRCRQCKWSRGPTLWQLWRPCRAISERLACPGWPFQGSLVQKGRATWLKLGGQSLGLKVFSPQEEVRIAESISCETLETLGHIGFRGGLLRILWEERVFVHRKEEAQERWGLGMHVRCSWSRLRSLTCKQAAASLTLIIESSLPSIPLPSFLESTFRLKVRF